MNKVFLTGKVEMKKYNDNIATFTLVVQREFKNDLGIYESDLIDVNVFDNYDDINIDDKVSFRGDVSVEYIGDIKVNRLYGKIEKM